MSSPGPSPRRPRTRRPAAGRLRRPAALLAVALVAVAGVSDSSPAAARTKSRKLASAAVAQRIVSLARRELALGVHEIPDGSNRAPAIRRYETATAGAMYGAPWCAYFVSYIADRAGAPIGPAGAGMGYVPYIRAWAHQTGRWTAIPRPGELITFPEHVGIVENVYSNHTLTTIEGNSSNAVRRRWRSWSEAMGYVRIASGSVKAPAPSAPPRAPVKPPSSGPVRQRLVARITAYPGTTVAVGQRIDFTSNDSSGDIVRSEWDLDGNGRFDHKGDSVSHTYTTPGTVTVALRVTDRSGHKATAKARVTVRSNKPPVAVLDLSSTTLTVGDTLKADASRSSDPDGKVVKYEWDLNGDGVFGEDGPQHSYKFSAPGDYIVGLRVTDDDGNVTETHAAVHVADYAPPVADPSCTDTVTTGQTITCTSDDSASPYRVTAHGWDYTGDGSDDQHGTTVRFTAAQAGDVPVRLTVTDTHGKTAVASTVVHVTDRPPTAKMTAPATVTLGQSATFDGTSSSDPDGTVASYAWDLDGDGTFETTGARPSFTYTAYGTYRVTLQVTDDSGSTATTTATVKVLAPPVARPVMTTASPRAGSTVSFSGATSSDADGTITRYRWDFTGDGFYDRSLTTATTTWTWATAGTYPVTLTVTDSSGLTASTTIWVTVTP